MGAGRTERRARDGEAPSRAPVAEEVWPRGALRLPLAAAARRGDAPSYCHLHSHYAIGPPPFRGTGTVAKPSAVGQAPRMSRPIPGADGLPGATIRGRETRRGGTRAEG